MVKFTNFHRIVFAESRSFTLPETNMTPENRPSQKESSLRTTIFQVRFVSFREGRSSSVSEEFSFHVNYPMSKKTNSTKNPKPQTYRIPTTTALNQSHRPAQLQVSNRLCVAHLMHGTNPVHSHPAGATSFRLGGNRWKKVLQGDW